VREQKGCLLDGGDFGGSVGGEVEFMVNDLDGGIFG